MTILYASGFDHQAFVTDHNGRSSWSTLYHQYIDTINKDPKDLLGEPVDNEEQLSDNESEYGVPEDEEHEEDWMYLAEMGTNSKINSTSDLGSRDMDRNHDWVNEPKPRYSFTDLETIGSFVLCSKHDQVEPLRILVMGTAGTGKSYLISAIKGRLRRMTGIGSKTPVRVIAPTGVAAFNINGSTIHSTLSIPILTDKSIDINGDRLRQLSEDDPLYCSAISASFRQCSIFPCTQLTYHEAPYQTTE